LNRTYSLELITLEQKRISARLQDVRSTLIFDLWM